MTAIQSPYVLPIRRLGSGVIHLAALMPESLGVGRFIKPFRGTDAPVVSLCAAQLNGVKVWMQETHTMCRRCERLASHRSLTVRFCDPAVDIPEDDENGRTGAAT